MEELKEKNFDTKLKKIFTRFKNEPEELRKMAESIIREDKELGQYADSRDIGRELHEFMKKHSEYIQGLWNIHSVVFFLTFKDIINECTEKNQKEYFISERFSPEDLAQIDIQSLFNYMLQLKPLNNTKNVYHFILFLLSYILIHKQNFYTYNSYISDFCKELESSMKNGSNNLNKKELQEIIPLFALELFISVGKSLESLVIKYECKQKYLSLKMFYYLLEILKREKFDIQIKELMYALLELLKKKGPWILEKCFNLFVNIFKGYPKRQIILFEDKENIEKYSQYSKTNSNYIKIMFDIIGLSFLFSFPYIIMQPGVNLKFTIDLPLNFKSKDFSEEEIPPLINNLLQLNRSNHTENAKQLIIFNLNMELNEKNISLREKIDKKFFDDYNNESFMEEIIIWKLYKKELSSDKSNQNYIKTILKGKFTEKEKLKFDLFENIKNSDVNKDIKGIDGTFYQSMFDTNKTICIIKLDLDYFKNHSFNLDPIQNEMKLIKKNNNNLDIYAQIENQIINLDNSFDLFMKELKNRNINLEDKKLNTNKIINLEKTSQENNSINNIEIDKLKLQLNEKDKALQKLKE